MMIRIITDTVADIPPDIARDLGITVVPLLLRFGEQSFRDGVDMDADEFYAKLCASPEPPQTSVPAPATFAETFDAVTADGSTALAITLSAKLSGTFNSALQGRALCTRPNAVEVMDSGWAAIGEGFIVMEAARAAAAGAGLEAARGAALAAAGRVDFLAAFDTLDYLRKGGRIGAAAGLVGSLLKINPLIGLREGIVHPMGVTRSRTKALEALVSFVRKFSRIDELAVGHAACPGDAEALVGSLSAFHPRERILRTRLTPVMGTHTGPGLIIVAVRGER